MPIALLLGTHSVPKKNLQNGFFIPKPPVRAMADRSFEDSFQVLKNLVSELGGATPLTESGAPRRVKPSSQEGFHERLQMKRNQLANEIAEENMTPNAMLDQRMSSTPKLNPYDYMPEEEQDREVPLPEQFGYAVNDSQRMKRDFTNPFGQPEEKPRQPKIGPLPYEQIRQLPDNPTNPFKLKSSPFDYAWTILKEDVNYLQDAIHSMMGMFGVDYQEAMRMVEQMHRHQLGQAGIPQDKIDRESPAFGGPASDYLNQQFAKPMAMNLNDVNIAMQEAKNYQKYKDDNSRRIGEQTSRAAITNRPRSNPRVPQMDEEASYANISIPRESPIHGLEPFGEDEPMGASLPMPMADDVLEPIRQRQRMQEPFNPFTAKPTPPPMREEQAPPMGGTEGMSRGPMRSRKRGDPAREPRFVRPGFRGPSMPMSDKSAESRMQ